jgi:hypothetical protein
MRARSAPSPRQTRLRRYVKALGDGESGAAVVGIVGRQMICLEGELLAADSHYEIEPDEDQPAHRLVSARQLGNVAGHNDLLNVCRSGRTGN